MAVLPVDYEDASTPTGAKTELPATTSRGVNAICSQINANTSAVAGTFPVGSYANLQAAIDACSAAGGGVVQLPAGATAVGARVEMKSKVVVQGPPMEWSVWGYDADPTDFNCAWLEPDTSTTDPVVNFADTVSCAGIRDLMIKGVATRDGIVLDGTTIRSGNRLRNVYVNGANIGIVCGQMEVRMQDICVMKCASDGVQINKQDCDWTGEGVVGYNGGNGVVLAEASGPLRLNTLDTFFNTGHGLLIDGFGHMLNIATANDNGKNGVLFRTAKGTIIATLCAHGNGQEYNGTTHTDRYSDVLFAHPTGGNQGCMILGGLIYLPDGSGAPTKNAVESTQATAGVPSLVGIEFAGTYVTGGSPYDLVNPLSSFTVSACHNVPNVTRSQGGVPALFAATGEDQLQFLDAGFNAASGVRQGGAIYMATATHVASWGTPSLDARTANVWYIVLDQSVASSTITNLQQGQQVTMVVAQNSTGNWTFVWPTNCRFAGAAAPSQTLTANRSDIVTFISDGSLLREISRSLGVN